MAYNISNTIQINNHNYMNSDFEKYQNNITKNISQVNPSKSNIKMKDIFKKPQKLMFLESSLKKEINNKLQLLDTPSKINKIDTNSKFNQFLSFSKQEENFTERKDNSENHAYVKKNITTSKLNLQNKKLIDISKKDSEILISSNEDSPFMNSTSNNNKNIVRYKNISVISMCEPLNNNNETYTERIYDTTTPFSNTELHKTNELICQIDENRENTITRRPEIEILNQLKKKKTIFNTNNKDKNLIIKESVKFNIDKTSPSFKSSKSSVSNNNNNDLIPLKKVNEGSEINKVVVYNVKNDNLIEIRSNHVVNYDKPDGRIVSKQVNINDSPFKKKKEKYSPNKFLNKVYNSNIESNEILRKEFKEKKELKKSKTCCFFW